MVVSCGGVWFGDVGVCVERLRAPEKKSCDMCGCAASEERVSDAVV